MPGGLGKTVRILVFAEGEGARLAQEAGADYVIDGDEGYNKIKGGWTDFDVAMAVPEAMKKVGGLGRVLGARGLMPNPKAGTVAPASDIPASSVRLVRAAPSSASTRRRIYMCRLAR